MGCGGSLPAEGQWKARATVLDVRPSHTQNGARFYHRDADSCRPPPRPQQRRVKELEAELEATRAVQVAPFPLRLAAAVGTTHMDYSCKPLGILTTRRPSRWGRGPRVNRWAG